MPPIMVIEGPLSFGSVISMPFLTQTLDGVDYLEVRVPHHPLGHQETVLILLLPKLRLAVLLPLVDDLWLDEPDAQSPIVVVQS